MSQTRRVHPRGLRVVAGDGVVHVLTGSATHLACSLSVAPHDATSTSDVVTCVRCLHWMSLP